MGVAISLPTPQNCRIFLSLIRIGSWYDTLGIVLVVISFVAGCALAIFGASFPKRLATYALLCVTSLGGACMPYFLRDPRTWIQTLVSATGLVGIPLFLMHVAPAIVAYHSVALLLRRKSRPSTHK